MKTGIILNLILFCGSTALLEAQNIDSQPAQPSQGVLPAPTPYAVVAKDANSSVWQQTVYQKGASGQVVPKIHSYTEVATGLHYQQNGQWLDSQEVISILPNGTAAATNGQHQAYFPGDIYQGQIELMTPGGLQLYSQPLGLSYFDGTNTVMIAVLTNSIGQVLGANQVIYTNAFTGLDADLLYTYTKAGFEQDIVLRQQPLTPESFGLNPDTARLQVLTEFFNPPQPAVQTTVLPAQAALPLTDTSLGFGVMRMIPGRAFLLNQNTSDVGAMVAKEWVQFEGRQLLVEEVPVNAIVAGLMTLPPPTVQPGSATPAVSKHLTLPPQRLVKNSTKPVRMAKASAPARGLVLDYQTVNGSLTNFTFQSDTTYYISGQAILYGTTTLEGGTVIKFAQASTGISSLGTIACNSSAYLPVALTAVDDNTVGEEFGSGSPSGLYSSIYLTVNQAADLEYLRVSYASCGVEFNAGNNILRHSQFVKNGNDVVLDAGATIENCLFQNSKSYTFSDTFGATETVNLQNCTAHDTPQLFSLYSGSSFTVGITNSLLIGVTNWGITFATSYNYTNLSDTGIFQTVGGASHYLANGSPYRSYGTGVIDPVLLASLRQKTTYPPLVTYFSATITTNLILSPQVSRDTNATPDLGYHYDPLDYVFSACDLYTNLNVTAGTAIGFFDNGNYGISMDDGANITFTGTASAPCWVTDPETVQEGGNGNWNHTYGYAAIKINGSGALPTPQLNATFSKWPVLATGDCHFQDAGAYGAGSFSDCEFYYSAIASYRASYYYFTNCLFFREQITYWAQNDAASCSMQNCTFYDGFFALTRKTGQSPSFWNIQNTAFDGTAIFMQDNFSGTTNTYFNYNAYDTGNNNWQVQSFGYTVTNKLEVVGLQDVLTNNFNWQASWLGSFYLPTNSPLIDMGSTNANYVGLYHFTTQTNQVKEANSIVDIGYHYVATDTNGIPLDTSGDGVPDYIEDANGNGLVDSGEIGWNTSNSQGFQVFITRPRSNGTLP